METEFAAEILSYLDQLEFSLTCPICDKKCVDPVRIKTCGHYVCKQCLKAQTNNHNCPKCNEFYEVRDLDEANLAKKCEAQLEKLRRMLELNSSARNHQDATAQPVLQKPPNIITYKANQYHINFINASAKTNSKGETPLHLACKRKNFAQVKALVESLVDLNAKDYAGWAPLHEAIQSQSLDIIEFLLQYKCLIDIPGPDFMTPLHQAAALGSVEMVELLLRYGANKSLKDYSGLTAEESSTDDAIKEIICQHSCSFTTPQTFEVFLPYDEVFLYCHSIDDSIKKELQSCKGIRVIEKMNAKRPTDYFVIKKTHKLSFKILQAMLEGQQFLTEDRVEEFKQGNRFINIPEVIFINNAELNLGIQKSSMSALLKLPKLFEGINFYIQHHTKPVKIYNLNVNKEYLGLLIQHGGGKLLHRPPATRTCEETPAHPFFSPEGSSTFKCCNYIIYDEKQSPELLYNMRELQHKTSKWLIDCIIRYEISN